jgi:hypothetical protein
MCAGSWRRADFGPRSWWGDAMPWRAGLIDSCGSWPGALDAAAFASQGDQVERRATVADPSGHGSRIARLLAGGGAGFELLLGQVFSTTAATSGAAVAAAVDWTVAAGANLIHMSLGLAADRAVLGSAVARAIESGCVIVASTPARGIATYPAAYPGVIRATGDARCARGELSCLGPWHFGGPTTAPATGNAGGQASGDSRGGGGASLGAAWVTRTILSGPQYSTTEALVAALSASARYTGPEQRRSP